MKRSIRTRWSLAALIGSVAIATWALAAPASAHQKHGRHQGFRWRGHNPHGHRARGLVAGLFADVCTRQ